MDQRRRRQQQQQQTISNVKRLQTLDLGRGEQLAAEKWDWT